MSKWFFLYNIEEYCMSSESVNNEIKVKICDRKVTGIKLK